MPLRMRLHNVFEVVSGVVVTLVRDDFMGSRHSLADGAAHAPEDAPHGLWLRGNVLVHGLEVFRSRFRTLSAIKQYQNIRDYPTRNPCKSALLELA